MVFTDRDLGTGVDEERDAGDPSLEWNKGALFGTACAYILSYKEALSSKNKVEQKQNQVNNSRHRARRQSISWVVGTWLQVYSKVKGHWRESTHALCLMTSVLRTACSSAHSCFPGTDKEQRALEKQHTREENNIWDSLRLNIPWHYLIFETIGSESDPGTLGSTFYAGNIAILWADTSQCGIDGGVRQFYHKISGAHS